MERLATVFFLLILFLGLGCQEAKEAETMDEGGARTRVGLLPFQGFQPTLMGEVETAIQQVYGFEVVKLQEVPLPKSAFVKVKSPRYRADTLLRFLRRNKPDSIDMVLGLTTSDISMTKRGKDGKVKSPAGKYGDWGIFGLGFRPGTAAVVSTYRLHHPDEKVFLARLRKIALHETGHNLGLPHCNSGKACLMQDAAETIRTIDRATESLCNNCKLVLSSSGYSMLF